MPTFNKITPCLWFDDKAEETANFYAGIFPDSRILNISHYSEAGREIHRRPAGSVMTVGFELAGQTFIALNGGPVFTFSEAISLQVGCESQAEIDHYWAKLSEGGDEQAQQCGWLKDRYGVSWQIVPTLLLQLLAQPESEGSQRAMLAMLSMKKLDIEKLKRAHSGVA
jgi:predicted 3-demethylubiquinone-9 3-methyltransferase (glyoxalase superfamily)